MNNTQKVLKNKHICEQATPNLGITQSSGLDGHAVISIEPLIPSRRKEFFSSLA